MRLARLAFEEPWPGRQIRRSATDLVKQAASGDIKDAQRLANKHLLLIRSELAQARAAADYLEFWANDSLESVLDFSEEPLPTGKTANLINVTIDTLRHWERNGLIVVPRNPDNGYRLYGSSEIGRLRVIRVLTRSGFSTMAVLRMIKQLDRGFREQLTRVLDTPGEDEDIHYATDRWLSTLQEHEDRARKIINQLQYIKDLHQA
jgi:DNA-binding transcriptional MerR regulator